ncbi:LysR family transcriptional regulator [Jannaschia sp. W003]|uniref:LysR family transcriptional regulator n=1 Tax=Jannaschia sp. W003 TaxID=2867012 RepID=UPI0021A42625|nr:LysR family transcriptional regulator [Jannaschia sp. W003]UWQ21534.1 LysR family transcriptional regulator [Jannaschia sp. W003]
MKDDRLVAMQVFRAVAETGGFSAAARALEASQPFVSQTVARLEARLGTPLLHRSTRGQRLTDEGEAFLHAARRALDAVEAAEAEVLDRRGEVAGTLRVTAPLAFGLDRIVPLLPAFSAAHPALTVDLSLTDERVGLIEHGVDVAIRMGRLEDSSLRARRLCALRRVVVAAPAFLDRHGRPERPPDLEAFDCLLWGGAREHLNHWRFREDGRDVEVAVRGRIRSDNGQSLFAMCLAGAGVFRAAEHLALPAIAAGALVPLLEHFDAGDDGAIHALHMGGPAALPRVRVFVDHLAAAFRDPPWR